MTVNDTNPEGNSPAEWEGVTRLRTLRDQFWARTGLVRLSVNINNETAKALKDISEASGLSYTETIRRAISVTHFLYAESRAGKQIFVADKKGNPISEITLLK